MKHLIFSSSLSIYSTPMYAVLERVSSYREERSNNISLLEKGLLSRPSFPLINRYLRKP